MHIPRLEQLPRLTAAAFQADFDAYFARVEQGEIFVIVGDDGREAVLLPAAVYRALKTQAGEPVDEALAEDPTGADVTDPDDQNR